MHLRRHHILSFLLLSISAGAAHAVIMEPPRLPPAAAHSASPADQAYSEGLNAFVNNDLAGAEKSFQKALSLQPAYAPALLGLAEIAFKKGQGEKAGTLLGKAVKVAPENAHAQASWGRFLAVGKRYPEAEAVLQKAMALDATLVRPRMDLADLYTTALRQPAKAVAIYQQVLAIDPGHAGAHYALGVALAKQGDLAKAQASLERSAQLDANNPLPSMALAQVAVQRKSLDDALRWVNAALKIQPAFADALVLRGDLQDARGNSPQSLSDYSAAARSAPGLAMAHFKLGSLLQRQNRVKDAMQAYRNAIKAAPDFALAYNNLAWLAAEGGSELSQAESWARQAVKLDPRSAAYLDTLGWVQRAKGQWADAEKSLRASLRIAPAADTYHHLGMVLKDAGKQADAEKAFRDALSLAPGHVGAKKALQALRP